MPARIVIVHDEPAFTGPLVKSLGRDAVLFTDPVKALGTLEKAMTVEFLICRVQFDDRQPVGLSLARVLRKVRPDVRIIFTGDPDHRHLVRGLGEFAPEPISPAYVAMIVEWLAGEQS
jgi:ActR/RegA family two-component response regulator